jgi:hypothetical protein
MSTPRLAILGSCVTRDAFEASNAVGAVALYLARSSMPVVCSPEVPVPQAFLTHHMPEWHRTTYNRFFTKTYFSELESARPDILIVDLIDDRFDYHFSDTILPGMADFLERLPIGRRGRPVDFMTEQGFEVWMAGARSFFSSIRSVVPDCRIVLHRARWAGDDEYARLNNVILERKFAAIDDLDRDVISVEAGPEHVVADEAHQWGKQPFHYIPSYYSAFNDRLKEILCG